jgi:hypothetical protein
LGAEGDELELHPLRSELFEMWGEKERVVRSRRKLPPRNGGKSFVILNDTSGLYGFLAGGNGRTDRKTRRLY